jgi:hypothetical protein
VLAGQPELGDRLNDSGLRQLKQRVALRCEIKPLNLSETAAYMAARIRTAGGDASRLFTREAVMVIHERSRGIPRTISVVCDNALVSGFALGRQPVDREVVLEVVRDFDLERDHLELASVDPPESTYDAEEPTAAPADNGRETEVDANHAPNLFSQTAATRRFGLFGSPPR